MPINPKIIRYKHVLSKNFKSLSIPNDFILIKDLKSFILHNDYKNVRSRKLKNYIKNELDITIYNYVTKQGNC